MTRQENADWAHGDATQLLVAILSAHTDLERVRGHLRVGAEATPEEVLGAVSAHWREHGAVHRAVGGMLADEVRRALLGQLYGWRRQLAEQLAALAALRQGE